MIMYTLFEPTIPYLVVYPNSEAWAMVLLYNIHLSIGMLWKKFLNVQQKSILVEYKV